MLNPQGSASSQGSEPYGALSAPSTPIRSFARDFNPSVALIGSEVTGDVHTSNVLQDDSNRGVSLEVDETRSDQGDATSLAIGPAGGGGFNKIA